MDGRAFCTSPEKKAAIALASSSALLQAECRVRPAAALRKVVRWEKKVASIQRNAEKGNSRKLSFRFLGFSETHRACICTHHLPGAVAVPIIVRASTLVPFSENLLWGDRWGKGKEELGTR